MMAYVVLLTKVYLTEIMLIALIIHFNLGLRPLKWEGVIDVCVDECSSLVVIQDTHTYHLRNPKHQW